MPDLLKFDLPKNQSSIIKVIGVGGGGSNAVNHMYRQGIRGVDFIICNTDAQAMESSPVPTRIQLGANLTSGLGAGAVPSVGRNAALENTEDIRSVLEKGTKMLFITAGLGGGTGTGAAPVIAQISKEMEILTVGIVTIPFAFEGRKRRQYAEDGIRQLKQQVDALLIISNDKLRELCGDLPLSEAFNRADNVLTTAAKGIAEIITVAGYINVDFEDVKTVMKDSGVAIMGNGVASGKDRALNAVEEALSSPLLDNNDIEGAQNLLLYISSGKSEITMDEVTEITDYIQNRTKSSAEVIWGNGFDESLDDKISVTIIATGFDKEHQEKDPTRPKNVKIHDLYGETTVPKVVSRVAEPSPDPILPGLLEEPEEIMIISSKPESPVIEPEPVTETSESPLRTFEFIVDRVEPEVKPDPMQIMVHDLQPVDSIEHPEPQMSSVTEPIMPPETPNQPDYPDINKKGNERVMKLRAMSEKLKTHTPIETNLQELESIPAYKRRNVELNEVTPSSESHIPRYSLSENPDKSLEIKSENSFLHKNVD